MIEVSRFLILKEFLKIGIFAFGPAASEVMIQRIVESRKWLDLSTFQDTISIAAIIPGPFHVNLSLALGYRLAGLSGGLLAALGFIIPGFTVALLISTFFQDEMVLEFIKEHQGMLLGSLAAIAGLLINLIIRLGKGVLHDKISWLLLALSGLLLYIFHFPFVLILFITGLSFMLIAKLRKNND